MAMLESLQQQRLNLKQSFIRLKTFIKDLKQEEVIIDELQVKLERTEEMFREFRKIEKDIYVLDKNDAPQFEAFEDLYFYVATHIKKAIRELTTSCDPNISGMISINDTINASRDRNSDVKLPKINIKPFNGEYTEWQTFYEMFLSSIHNSTLQPVQKYQYLMSLLKEKPARLLKHMPITDANYLLAINKLKARYDRKKYSVEQFIQTFMEQPKITNANADSIRQLHDVSDEVIRGLKGLGKAAEQRDPWLLHILINKIDQKSRSQWAQKIVDDDYPTIDKFFEFLESRADALETFSTERHVKSSVKPQKLYSFTTTFTCSVCHTNQHQLYQCVKFQDMSVDERRKLMRNERRCFNCLADNHIVYECKSKRSCHHCHKRHNSLLHLDDNKSTNNTKKQFNINLATTEEMSSSASHSCNQNNHMISSTASKPNVNKNEAIDNISTKESGSSTCLQQSIEPISTLLPTALVNILDSVGQWQTCRVLLDSGSESSFITEQCIQRLGLPREHARLQIRGLNHLEAGFTKGVTSVTIRPHFNSKFQLIVKAYVTPSITNVVAPVTVKVSFLNRLDLNYLADPSRPYNRRIDLLIGAEHFFSLMSKDQIKSRDSSIIAQRTKLGWIMAGSCTNKDEKGVSTFCTELNDVNDSLKQFWADENLPTIEKFEPEPNEEFCEKFFCKTTKRRHDGHYVVKLPFIDSSSALGESYYTAKARLLAMERKFKQNHDFHIRYRDFMAEYEKLGHMTKMTTRTTGFSLFLPHHGVYKESSSTTKMRVVFDASAKTSTGKSLNDILAIGPNIQSSLFFILLQFRAHAVVFVADIEKMYRQMWLQPTDRKFQRILWREEPGQPIDIYELNTITYGMSPSSFLATRVLKAVADENEINYPKAANAIRNHIYMDDLMNGASTIHEAIQLKREINLILIKAGLNLRKWMSNNMDVLLESDEQPMQTKKEFDTHADSTKVLGFLWSPAEDAFTYSVRLNSIPSTTKRGLLSESSRLFDSLGLLSPFTIRVKMFYQSLWLKNISWDEELPQPLLNEWLTMRTEMNDLADLKVPRWMHTINNSTISMHGFCDASENAYAASIYICDSTKRTSRLLAAKTKVAPLENVSIARLELNGALILTRLMKYVKEIYNTTDSQMFAWTDSKVVLDWISHVPKRWKVYVANRTSEIRQSLPRERWHYVNSAQNPADCATKGLTPAKLRDHSLWWNGPEFILQEKSHWPIMGKVNSTNQLEMRHNLINMNVATTEVQSIIYETYKRNANYRRFLGILTYIFRWYYNKKVEKTIKQIGCLKLEEIRVTSDRVYREIQNQHFADEIRCLKKNEQIQVKSKLKALDSILDSNGIVRVGGRIERAPLPFQQKHPVVLPGDDPIVKGMVVYYHLKYLHCGPSYLYNVLKREFWITKARSIIKEIINGCINCTKQKKRLSSQKMGMLPKERVELGKPFMKVGIDFAGPIKTYCIKAIHIEIVSNLSTDAFLAAFARFIARRGMCTDIFTDNGPNFHGAQRKLAELNQFLKINSKLIATKLLREHEVNWHFIPPYAPHFGGLWEAGVKSIKTQLERVIGSQILTTEELETLLVQVEGMLNQRPLYRASSDDDDILTPAHYLVGQQLLPVTQPDITEGYNRLNHWQIVQNEKG